MNITSVYRPYIQKLQNYIQKYSLGSLLSILKSCDFATIKTKHIMTGSIFIDFDKALNKGIRLIKTNENASFGLLIICGINLGLRIDDLLKLTFKDLRSDTIIIIEGKTKKKRNLVINDNIKTALKYFKDSNRGYAFKSQKTLREKYLLIH
jgi:integrase